MKRSFHLVLLLFTIIDFAIIYFIDIKIYLWGAHFINYIIFHIWNQMVFKENIEYQDIMIIVLPGLGFFTFLLKEIFLSQKKFTDKLEDESLEKYIQNKRKIEQINTVIELNLIGAYDSLSIGTPKEKKKFLMEFDYPNLKFKIEVLKKALRDNDIDVIHYAATEISKLDESFQKKIKNCIEKKSQREIATAYVEYCDSGLLEGTILEFYQCKAIEILENLYEKSKEELITLLKIYKDTGRYEKCQSMLEEIYKKQEIDRKLIDFATEFYYEQNNSSEVKKWLKFA